MFELWKQILCIYVKAKMGLRTDSLQIYEAKKGNFLDNDDDERNCKAESLSGDTRKNHYRKIIFVLKICFLAVKKSRN